MQSLVVEGGRRTRESFIEQGLWEEAYVELSTTELGSGVPEPRMPVGILLQTEEAFGATIFHYTNG